MAANKNLQQEFHLVNEVSLLQILVFQTRNLDALLVQFCLHYFL